MRILIITLAILTSISTALHGSVALEETGYQLLPFRFEGDRFDNDDTLSSPSGFDKIGPCACLMVTPYAVLIKEKHAGMHKPSQKSQRTPYWDLKNDDFNVQVVAGTFSTINERLLRAFGFFGITVASYCAGRYFAHSSSYVPKMTGSLFKGISALACLGSGVLLFSLWLKRNKFAQLYPYQVPDKLCDLLNIEVSKRKNYRCAKPEYVDLNRYSISEQEIEERYGTNGVHRTVPVVLVQDFMAK